MISAETLKKPMIPLAVPNLIGREAEYLQECVTSTFVSSVGPFVNRFEVAVAQASGAEAAVATSAGTTAIHAALVSLGIGQDHLVLVPSLTFIATVSGIHWAGAKPWFVEVSPESWTIDPDRLEILLEQNVVVGPDGTRHRDTGLLVKALMPVYTLGNPPDMDRLTAIARRYGLVIVADAAAALGATYKGRALGQWGADLSIISFNGNKTVTAGGGGAVIGSAERVAKVRHLTTTARIGADYLHDAIGFNYRMTNLQAAVGFAQMENLDYFVNRKREIRERYERGFSDIESLASFPVPTWGESASWFSGVVVENSTEERTRDIINALREHRIDARTFWMPLHLQPPLKSELADDLTFSEAVWFQILPLPSSTSLLEAEIDYIIEKVGEVVRISERY